jgi:hypothetical protein
MVTVTGLPGRISPVKDLAVAKIKMVVHVRSRSRTCPVLLAGLTKSEWSRHVRSRGLMKSEWSRHVQVGADMSGFAY